MRPFFLRIHLYLGLCAGLVVMVSCLTGSLLVFQEELERTFNHELYYVQPGTTCVPLADITEQVKGGVKGIKIMNVRVYNDPSRSVEVTYQLKNKNKGTKQGGEKQKPEDNIKAYVNPYTGDIIRTVEVRKTFFHKVLFLHRQLLSGDTGKLITGISTLVFVFIIITGVVLWWPAKRNTLKQRLVIKRNAGWKRTLHDLHTVIGFYCAVLLFVFAFTGLAWSFKWFNNGIYYLSNSPLKNPEPPLSTAPFLKDNKNRALTAAFETAARAYPKAAYYQVNYPKGDSAVWVINVLKDKGGAKNKVDALYFDQYSGAQVGALLWQDRSTGAKIRSYFLPVHTGTILGLPTRILALLATLLGTTLPVTGVIMWLNKQKRKNRE